MGIHCGLERRKLGDLDTEKGQLLVAGTGESS